MSSLWSSRIQTTKATNGCRDNEAPEDASIGNILAMAYQSLVQIENSLLFADKFLGAGSVFQVNREIYKETHHSPLSYYVAVKYMRLEQRPETRRQILTALTRELKVITHSVLRSHPHICSALAFGFTNPNLGQPRPFLVMPYAEFGTLSEVLQAVRMHRQISILEQRDLALDVALGLQALHESGFIHGDVKTNNVLVSSRSYPLGYDSGNDGIPWIAKVADFGSSLSREDAEGHAFHYTGTALYNAPEIENGEVLRDRVFEAYKKADTYSFGLLLWEILESGSFYLDTIKEYDALIAQKRYREFLQKTHDRSGNAMFKIALTSLQDARDEITDQKCWDKIVRTLESCLNREGRFRKDMKRVAEELQGSIVSDRSPVVYSLPKLTSQPVTKPTMVGPLPQNRPYPIMTPGLWQLQPFRSTEVHPTGTTFRPIPRDAVMKDRLLIPYRRLDSRDLETPQSRECNGLSLQHAILSPLPPREIQERLVEQWETQVHNGQDSKVISQACLELSICHYFGFGCEPDRLASLQFLRQASFGSTTAKAIVGRISAAFLKTKDGGIDNERPYNDGKDAAYFSQRLLSTNSTIIMRPTLQAKPRLSLRPGHYPDSSRVELVIRLIRQELDCRQDMRGSVDINRLEQLWASHIRKESTPLESLSQLDISASLTESCRLGLFETAKALAAMCLQFIGRFGNPNPLHWLIMFPPDQAQYIAELLVLGIKGKKPYGICFHCLNSRISSITFLPEHCMELIGTPLHWAVRGRNLALVRKLLDLGADMAVRYAPHVPILGEPPSIGRAAYSPLDLALEFHLHEIAELLLDHSRLQGAGNELEIAPSIMAHTATPFSRFIIHGPYYRIALRKTIEVLSRRGYNINRSDYFGDQPLLVSLRNAAHEEYITEELLKANAYLSESLPGNDNLAILVVLSAGTDHPSRAFKLQQILHLVEDLNACNDKGYNALHYCAFTSNASMAKVLLSSGQVDISAKSSNKYQSTPLIIAAEYGGVAILNILLEVGADPDSSNARGETGLECAIRNRQYETASLLIEHGACLCFRSRNSVPQDTVLHAACVGPSNRPPLVRRLLMGHAKLREHDVLHQTIDKRYGFGAKTPLHQAIMFADLDSAKALLEYGADGNYWTHPPELDASNRITKILHKQTAFDFLNRLLSRAKTKGLYGEQIQAARQGQLQNSRLIMNGKYFDQSQERLEWEKFDGVPQFNIRLEEIQSQQQGQAGVRSFIARLEEIRRIMVTRGCEETDPETLRLPFLLKQSKESE